MKHHHGQRYATEDAAILQDRMAASVGTATLRELAAATGSTKSGTHKRIQYGAGLETFLAVGRLCQLLGVETDDLLGPNWRESAA